MGQYIIAYDLGTGGNKSLLYTVEGEVLAESFIPCETMYPASGCHEQRPLDWWNAVVEGTRRLLSQAAVNRSEVECIGISGHSLGVVPLDRAGRLLRDSTPIWSDSRASLQASRFFETVDETEWYNITGNGFPPPLYSVFKIMWYRDNEPEVFRKIHKIVGTKDFINFMLAGRLLTDHSYASGSGVYDLLKWDYSDKLISASGLSREIFPGICSSTQVIGQLTAQAAEALGLARTVKVVAGGVDNSCMALGACNTKPGRVYNSLGSSSWIAVSSKEPLLDERRRPYVFAHVIPGMFTSAMSIFSAGSSLRWVRDNLCQNILAQAERQGANSYDLMTGLAKQSPVGANGLIFNPSLAGGTSLDDSPNVRGAYVGLDLRHTQADIIRAAMEGVAMGLRLALGELRKHTTLRQEMLMVGGGSRSRLWRQICADVFEMSVVRTNVDEQAAALGAAALAAVGTGLWQDISRIESRHKVKDIAKPVPANSAVYKRLLPIFRLVASDQARTGDQLTTAGLQ